MASLIGNLIGLPISIIGGAFDGLAGGLGGGGGGGQQTQQAQGHAGGGSMDLGTIALIGGGLLAVVFVLKK